MNVYDFDKTIYNGDSTIDFYVYCLKKYPKLIFEIPKQILNIGLYIIGKYDKKKFKENFYTFLKHIKNIYEEVEKFCDKKENKIKQFYKEQKKEDDVIISASPLFLLKPICERLKIKNLIASKVDKKNGKYDGENCYGEEKVKRFHKIYKEEKVDNFYSDSKSDEPLAKIASNAYIVEENKIVKWCEYKPSFIKKIKNIFFDKSFILFLAVGAINTFNGIVLSYVYSLFINNANIAFIFGYITSLLISYLLNSIITFKEKLNYAKLIKFCISYIPNFIIQNIVVFIVYNLLNWHHIIAYTIAAIIGIPITFILMKFFAFKNNKDKIKTNNEAIIDVIKDSGIILLFVITNIILVTSILFFVHIEATKWHLPIIYLLSNIEYLLIFNKKKKNIYKILSIIIALCVFIGSIIFCGKFYDLTADGNNYHKLAVGSLKNGWNPVYQDNEDFNIEQGNAVDSSDSSSTLWTNHYTKGTWIFSSVIYSFTGNIETGKCTSILLMYVCFCYIFSYLTNKMKIYYALTISILVAVNPISIVQSLNYYIDGDLGNTLNIIICALIAITDEKLYKKRMENFLILAYTLIICINIKFTGLAFAGIFCFMFYLYWLYNSIKYNGEKFKKDIINYTLFYVAVVLIAVGIVGFSSYVKNTVEHGHPFYPLYGKGKVDIITTMQPNYFSERNAIQKVLISWFSKGENVTYSYESNEIKPKLKIPFTFSKEEIKNYNIPDIRISGFGPLFGGIILISSVTTIYSLYDLIKNNKKSIYIPYMILLGGVVILLLIVDGGWWARYTPYVYFIPISTLIYLWINKNSKLKTILGYILVTLIIINSLMILYSTYKNCKINNFYINKRLSIFKEYSENNGKSKIKLRDKNTLGTLYNLDDLGIKYQIDDSIEIVEDGYMFGF